MIRNAMIRLENENNDNLKIPVCLLCYDEVCLTRKLQVLYYQSEVISWRGIRQYAYFSSSTLIFVLCVGEK
jgi:hypothetical protein